MAFINSEVQVAFFEIICKRRIKRVMYGATLYHLEMLFDRCLNIILCHHPHIWSYGTGNLLVAPNTPEIITKAVERAIEWRKESLNKQHEDLNQIIGNSFGYFIRYSIECRARVQSGNKVKQRCLHLVQILIEHTNNNLPLLPEIDTNKTSKDEVRRVIQIFPKIFAKVSSDLDTPIIDVFWEKLVYDMYLQMFRYVDVPVPPLADLILNINAVSRKGFFRYGKSFIKDGCLTDGKQCDIIIECNRRPRVTILREFMFDDIETISRLVIPPSFLYADEKKECVICLEKKDVLVWPCHTSHVTCTQCTIELVSLAVFCPLCRQSLSFIYGKWYLDNYDDDNTWLFVLHNLWYEWHLRK